jgi:hypothetical protein
MVNEKPETLFLGGKLLLELNRVLRPGGYFAWSATPVYQKLEEDVQIWKGRITYHIYICYLEDFNSTILICVSF